MTEEYYKQKYLKYKEKYLELQTQLGGNIFSKLFRNKKKEDKQIDEKQKNDINLLEKKIIIIKITEEIINNYIRIFLIDYYNKNLSTVRPKKNYTV